MFAVVPVAVAIMTPVPLLLMYIYSKFSARWNKKKQTVLSLDDDERMDSAAPSIVTEPISIGSGKIK
jgi:hypothetical protein